MLRPFRIGAQEVDDNVYDETKTLTAGAQQMPQYNVPATAFIRAFYILIENVVTSSTATATGTGAVGVLKADGPYALIETFQLTDTNGNEIIGPVTGYDLHIIDKWGGYCFNDDAGESNTDLFTATTNATASSSASGSFSFTLRIPVELVPRDALGALPNKSASTPFKIKYMVAAIASVYESSATVGGSCRVRIMPDSYWEPTPTDGSGNQVAGDPPGVNTTQYWNVTPYERSAGNFTIQLLNSVGFPVRNLGFLLELTSDGSRATGETDFPDLFQLQLQSNLIINRLKKIWKRKISEWYGYNAAGDLAGQKDNGLYWQPYNNDFSQKPGWESRRAYLRTTDGMRLEMKGTIGGSNNHTFTVYTNYVGVGAGSTLARLTT
jgi:hypothetical protein